jgi:hypothetical protein
LMETSKNSFSYWFKAISMQSPSIIKTWLSKLFNSNNKIAKSLNEFSVLVNNYINNDKKKIKYDNYKNFWGHTTCPIVIFKLKNFKKSW